MIIRIFATLCFLLAAISSFGLEQSIFSLGLDIGYRFLNVSELVESNEEAVHEYLSELHWKTGAMYAGLTLDCSPFRRLYCHLAVGGSLNLAGGNLVDLDFMDPDSSAFTHYSSSPVRYKGLQWNAEIGFAFIDREKIRIYVNVGYDGYFDVWEAVGGYYEYPEESGTFENVTVIEYMVLFHRPYAGFRFVFAPSRKHSLEAGGNISYYSFVNDRDTHELRDLMFYDEYRFGWSAELSFSWGIRLNKGTVMEFYYSPFMQFAFNESSTKIKSGSAVVAVSEKPNFLHTEHKLGLRLVWQIF